MSTCSGGSSLSSGTHSSAWEAMMRASNKVSGHETGRGTSADSHERNSPERTASSCLARFSSVRMSSDCRRNYSISKCSLVFAACSAFERCLAELRAAAGESAEFAGEERSVPIANPRALAAFILSRSSSASCA